MEKMNLFGKKDGVLEIVRGCIINGDLDIDKLNYEFSQLDMPELSADEEAELIAKIDSMDYKVDKCEE